jgi:hypothetical protein
MPPGEPRGDWTVSKTRRALAGLGLLVAPLTIELTLAEFVELQRMTAVELRARFDFPASCTPRIAAVGSGRTAIVAVVRCEAAAMRTTPSAVRPPRTERHPDR